MGAFVTFSQKESHLRWMSRLAVGLCRKILSRATCLFIIIIIFIMMIIIKNIIIIIIIINIIITIMMIIIKRPD